MKAKTRYIPKGYAEFKPDLGDYPKDMFAAYINTDPSYGPTAVFYVGKRSAPLWHYAFKTTDALKAKVNETIKNLMSNYEHKLKRAEARKAPSTLKAGDILTVSWGYDQTNVDFFQVVGTRGTRTVDIREIVSKRVDDNGPTTHVVAVKDAFITPGSDTDKRGRVMTKLVSDGHVKVYPFASAYLWDGLPKYETGMGYGH